MTMVEGAKKCAKIEKKILCSCKKADRGERKILWFYSLENRRPDEPLLGKILLAREREGVGSCSINEPWGNRDISNVGKKRKEAKADGQGGHRDGDPLPPVKQSFRKKASKRRTTLKRNESPSLMRVEEPISHALMALFQRPGLSYKAKVRPKGNRRKSGRGANARKKNMPPWRVFSNTAGLNRKLSPEAGSPKGKNRGSGGSNHLGLTVIVATKRKEPAGIEKESQDQRFEIKVMRQKGRQPKR